MYDTNTKILILNNVVIDDASCDWGLIVREEGVTIKLIGENIIRAKNGILAEKSFKIEGTEGSTLSVTAGEKGIVGRNSVEISGCNIRIHSADQAMMIDRELVLRKADIEIEAGTYAGDGVYTLSCERLEVSCSSNLNVAAHSSWPALYISEKAFIKNSTVNVASGASAGISGKELEISGAALRASGKGRGWPTMYLSGKVRIADSNGEIVSDASNGIYCRELDILRSDFRIYTKKTGGCSIYTWGDISVQGGRLKVEDGSVRSEGNIVIDGVIAENKGS